ncbi:MAG: radical SAM protein, partial [Candidatus Omnitrophica bacterium]|nr:radical SAM protein [Candidatus Omnitrophota bacterium]
EVPRHEEEMKAAEIDRFFSRNNRILWLNIGGGEICLREDLSEIIGIIYKRLPHLVLLDFATTGYFKDKVLRLAEEIARQKPRKVLITVSLDGPKGIHERLRGVAGSWEKAVETFRGLQAFERFGIKPYFGFTVNRENADSFFETVEEVKKAVPGITLSDFHLNLAQVSPVYYRNEGFLDKEWAFAERQKIIALLRAFLAAKDKGHPVISFLENTYQKKLKAYLASRRTPLPCKALSSSCFIDPYWNVYPCVSHDLPMGDLRACDFDLRKIWETPAAVKARCDIGKGLCPHCWTPCEAYQTIFGNLAKSIFNSA